MKKQKENMMIQRGKMNEEVRLEELPLAECLLRRFLLIFLIYFLFI